jgi:hypothetical protein
VVHRVVVSRAFPRSAWAVAAVSGRRRVADDAEWVPADAIKRASSSGSDVINEILAGNPQVQASYPFALLENRTITGQPRQITG